jgi:SAM-dependent methyltransferase
VLIHDTTARVRDFYEHTPFPNYDELETPAELVAKAKRGTLASLLDRDIPFRVRVLDMGCGTGQLPLFLSLASRNVVGADLSRASLRLGEQFRCRNGLTRVHFVQCDLFRPPFPASSFDYVISTGVLHHTADPARALAAVAALVKPGGYIVAGFYNAYARLPLKARGIILRMTGGRFSWIDPVLRKFAVSSDKRTSWYRDQYEHPAEVSVSLDTVLKWFRETGLTYVATVPSIGNRSRDGNLFAASAPGSRVSRWLRQIGWAFTIGREGGLFVVIGRKEYADARSVAEVMR